jgi:hypothetical protein
VPLRSVRASAEKAEEQMSPDFRNQFGVPLHEIDPGHPSGYHHIGCNQIDIPHFFLELLGEHWAHRSREGGDTISAVGVG